MAGFLIAVFFTSQAFSCCLVNHKLGQYLISAWNHSHGTVEEHACCPSAQKESDSASKPDSQQNGCCIQDANQKVPQVGSEVAEVPNLPLFVIETLPSIATWKPSRPEVHSLLTAAGPPIYLATLRLLI